MKKILALVCALFVFCASVFAKENISLENATVEEIQNALYGGLISCEELTEYCINRIEEYNEEYNCFISLCETALEQAREKDIQLKNGSTQGALFGVPVVVKDNMDLMGYRTTNGYKYGTVAEENSYAVQRLIDEGAIIIGKTNMSTGAESARSSFSESIGHTKNAYNPLLSPGGSSGGSAVAVSLNFAFIGLGTDTNSSLRIPAALNGCISLRPTYGLISMDGIELLNETRDTAGAITDNVYDQALVLDVLTNFEYSYTENLKDGAFVGLRVGVLKELCFNEKADKEVLTAFKKSLKEMEELGAKVVRVSSPEIWEYAEIAAEWDSEYYRNGLKEMVNKLMEENELDVLVFPSVLSSPIPIDESHKMNSSPWLNNTDKLAPAMGYPEISLPIGVHSEGSGIGIEILAKENEEQLLLNLAYSYMNFYNHRTVPIADTSGIVLTEALSSFYKEQSETGITEETKAQNPYLGAVYGSVAIILLLAFAAYSRKKT